MNCWKCQKQMSLEPVKIGFRSTCQHCGSDLHACVNCRYDSPGKPNNCEIPGTEYIRDREAANFCEEFKARAQSEKLDNKDVREIFNSLFKKP